MDLTLQRAAPKTTSHSSSPEAIGAPTSSEPAQHRQASASGNSRPLSQRSVASRNRHLTRSARTEGEGSVVEVAQGGANEGGEGAIVVEEVVEETEDTKGDMDNVSACTNTCMYYDM